jgi:hypothetical protein
MSPSPSQLTEQRASRRSLAFIRLLAGFAIATTTLAGLTPARAFAAANTIEYQLKAGFLFNFAKFVEWPDESLAAGVGVRLGIIAPDEVYHLMEKSLSGKLIGDRPLIVERLTAAEIEAGTALPNIIFVHQDTFRLPSERGISAQQLAALVEKKPVLLVGESAGFATSGGIIGFVQRGENLRFQVNLSSAQRAGLKLSARLSGLAEIVSSTKP